MHSHAATNVRSRRQQAWGALALGLAGWLAQPVLAAPQTESVTERFEAWRLAVATGVLSPAARSELDALAKEAESAATISGATEETREAWLRIQDEQLAIAPQAALSANQSAQNAPEDEVLKRSILSSIKSGNSEFIERLGTRATPALAALARATDGSPTPEGELDPLWMLFVVDAAAGMDVALELMSSKSFLIKRATIRWVNEFLAKDDLFLPVGDTDWAFVHPAWAAIATLAFEVPALSASAVRGTLAQLVRRGLLPRELADQALDITSAHGHGGATPESILWLSELRLTDPRESVRLLGIHELLRSGRVAPVLPLVVDPSRDVVMTLVQSILQTNVSTYKDRTSPSNDYETKTIYLPFDPPLFEAFKTLAMSEDREVSNVTWEVMSRRLEIEEATQLDTAQLRSLIPLAKTQHQLSALAWHAQAVPESERVTLVKDVLLGAAKIELSAEDQKLFQRSIFNLAKGGPKLDLHDSFWELVFAMGETLTLEPGVAREVSTWAQREVTSSVQLGVNPGSLPAAPIVKWLELYGAIDHWSILENWRGLIVAQPWILELTQAEQGQMLKVYGRHYTAAENPGYFQLGQLLDRPPVEDPAVLRALLLDADVAPIVRAWALEVLYRHHTTSVDEGLVDAAADTLVKLDQWSTANRILRNDKLDAIANRVMRAILEHPDSTDRLILGMDILPDDETFTLLAKRFPVETWGQLGFPSQLKQCLGVLIDRSQDALHPMLESLDLSDHELNRWVAERIAANRTPALFPLARRVMERSLSGTPAWKAAVDAVAGYFTDEAAAALLEAAKTTRDEESRQRVMLGIRQITEWREAAAAWQTSIGAEAKRAKAIESLVATIEDAAAPLEARAASMRGLGLLGAVEELPRIIAALGSPEDELKAAARAALKRLDE